MPCFLLTIVGFAQVKHFRVSESNSNISFACNFFDQNTEYNPSMAQNIPDSVSEGWMNEMVDKITSVVGLKNRFRLRAEKNFNNCAAVCYNNNIGEERYILFDRAFLEEYQRITKNKWFVIGALAHELGHHLNGHSLDGIGSRPDKELDADEFAGFIMGKLGAKENEAQSIFSFMNSTDGPPTHPLRKERYVAISKGWNKASSNITNNLFADLYVLRDGDYKQKAYDFLIAARNESDETKKMSLINESLKIVPKYAEAISEKGLVYSSMNQFLEAKKFCTDALILEPYIGLLRLNMAQIYYKKKVYDSSIAYIADALFLKPVFSEAYSMRSLIFFENQDYSQTISDCNLALAMNPSTNYLKGQIWETKGFAWYELQNKEEADACFIIAKKLNPLSIRVFEYFRSKSK